MDFDVVPYEDIVWGERIGGGSFGSVFKGQYLGIDIAIKEIHMSNQYDVHKYFEREWRIMRECRHPNIVLFLGLSKETEGDGRVFIVSEFIPRGNLRSFIRSHAPFPWRMRISFATDVARAVAYLHARQCLHRDLKGENLMITSNDRLKVADFGFARITGRNEEEMKHMTYCGTDGYMSPEIIMGEPFDLPTDIYSLGIIFIEILTRILVGSKVYSRKAPTFIPDSDIVRGRASAGCPPDFIELALECCRFTPSERPAMPEVLARLRKIEREIERGVADLDVPHVGSVRATRKNLYALSSEPRQGADALKALFDVSAEDSDWAVQEVEAEVGGFEVHDDDDECDPDEAIASIPPMDEAKEWKAIAQAHVAVDGAGPTKRIPWDEMTSDFMEGHVSIRAAESPQSGAEPLLGSSSILSWRTASPEQKSAVLPQVTGSQIYIGPNPPQPDDQSYASPVRPMPCDYPPSPPYDNDESMGSTIGSTCTIRGSHTSRAMTPEDEPPTPTQGMHPAVVLIWDSTEPAKGSPLKSQLSIDIPTPESSDGATKPPIISPKSTHRSTHRFSIMRRVPEPPPVGRKPAILSVAANLAFAFLPRPSAKDKCSACTKQMGSRVVLQCDDCGMLVHTKCSTIAPRNCHTHSAPPSAAKAAPAACALGVDP